MSLMSTFTTLPVRLQTVPPFPPVATRLLCMICSDDVRIDEVADLISTDPMFAGRILQYANSAELGLEYPITNLRQALTTLGLDRARNITVTAATAAFAMGSLRTSEMERCWRHTLAVAVLSEEISRSCGVFMESAYTAGLMHDVGRLALLVAYPAEYEATIRNCAERCLDLLDFERERFGVHHAEAGRLLSMRWGLPEQFHVILGRHHDSSDDGSELSLLRIVHVACRVADALGYYVTRPLLAGPLDQIACALPATARRMIESNAEALRNRIDATIRSFENVNDDPQQYLPQGAQAAEVDTDTVDSAAETRRAEGPWFLSVLPRMIMDFLSRFGRMFRFN
jgi:HD-like signal output (HDOD) protein